MDRPLALAPRRCRTPSRRAEAICIGKVAKRPINRSETVRTCCYDHARQVALHERLTASDRQAMAANDVPSMSKSLLAFQPNGLRRS